MSFNPGYTKPAEEIIFSHKRTCQDHPPLFVNNTEVKQVNDHKHRGLTLDSKLTFVNHSSEEVSKARKSLFVIKYHSCCALVNNLDRIYKMCIRLHLDFCDFILSQTKKFWFIWFFVSPINWMNLINSVQYQAALSLTGTWEGTSTNKIDEEVG